MMQRTTTADPSSPTTVESEKTKGLDDDTLRAVLKFLPPGQYFFVGRVNRQFRKVYPHPRITCIKERGQGASKATLQYWRDQARHHGLYGSC